MVSVFQRHQLSKVNARHLLDDLASSYTYALDDAVLVELIANSLDAKAANIRIRLDPNKSTLTVHDDGAGMTQDEFERYHDLAESTKVRGRGIGFAGLGAKLAHQVGKRVVTETRSESYRGASEWGFKGSDLQWRNIRRRTLRSTGTAVSIELSARWKRILTEDFVRRMVERHFGPLLDPFLSQLYVWESIYPEGVTFHVNGDALPQRPLVPTIRVESRKDLDIYWRNRKRLGRAIFILTRDPLPEEEQGIVIGTYGKAIRRDSLGVRSRNPERITGWFESPALVESLTLNKQDFWDHGSQGERFHRARRELQRAMQSWLDEIGESRETDPRRRAPRTLERETARILRRIPPLRYLFARRMNEPVAVPDPASDGVATVVEGLQASHGSRPTSDNGQAPLWSPGPDPGETLTPEEDGDATARIRERTVRGGPRIERVSDPSRPEVGWVEGDAVIINTAHPAYTTSERRRFLSYHEPLAIFYALCAEASVQPEEKLPLLNTALSEWGSQG